jgi:uncharacterized RDD family membrane protein YckC
VQYQPPGYQPQPPGYQPPPVPPGWQQPYVPQKPVWAGPPLASWGSRVGATLLDGLVLFIAVIALAAPGVICLVAGAKVAGIVLLILGGLAYAVIYVLYGAYLMNRPGERNGQTLGKQWVGIRVVRDTTEPFGFGQALLREFVVKIMLFGWVGGSFFLAIPSLLDHLWPLWEDENRALHDLIVKTHVVRA